MLVAVDGRSTAEGLFHPRLEADGESPTQSCYLFTFTVPQNIAQATVPGLLEACLMTEDAVVFMKPAYVPFHFFLRSSFLPAVLLWQSHFSRDHMGIFSLEPRRSRCPERLSNALRAQGSQVSPGQ